MLKFLKNETLTYEVYKSRFVYGICTAIALFFITGLNLTRFNFILHLMCSLAYAAAWIFTIYNLYRAILAGIGVYDLKGLLTVIKKLIDKV